MRKPSKGCKKRDANDHPSDHSDDNGTHFFKILIGDFHKRLVIPGKFAKHFIGKIEGSVVTLESLGCTFDVQVAQNSGRTEFQSGWKSFVSAHDLKMLDLLVFKYDGMSRMKVLIFDPSGCEKVPPCFVTKNAISGGRRREEPIEITSGYVNLPNPSGMTSSEDDEAHSVPIPVQKKHSVPSYMLARGTRLGSMQEKKLKERLRAISSEIPIYVCVVKKTNISGKYKTMDFCRKYSDECLPFKKNRALILQCHGKSWEVTCRIQVQNDRGGFKRICSRWARFARDNNLQLGDICLFEPLKLKTKKFRMNVHIIRKK